MNWADTGIEDNINYPWSPRLAEKNSYPFDPIHLKFTHIDHNETWPQLHHYRWVPPGGDAAYLYEDNACSHELPPLSAYQAAYLAELHNEVRDMSAEVNRRWLVNPLRDARKVKPEWQG